MTETHVVIFLQTVLSFLWVSTFEQQVLSVILPVLAFTLQELSIISSILVFAYCYFIKNVKGDQKNMKKEAHIKYASNKFTTLKLQPNDQGATTILIATCRSQNIRLYDTFVVVKKELSKIAF